MARLTEIVHHYLADHLRPGDLALDATAGNGHDTAFLAECVRPGGNVVAMDRQRAAIHATRERLENAGLDACCTLIEGDHAETIPNLNGNNIRAAVFNLGYLPGSDKTIQTNPARTIRALDACLPRLAPDAILLVTAYRGHDGGIEEAAAVADWMDRLEAVPNWHLTRREPASRGPHLPPVLWVARSHRMVQDGRSWESSF